MEVIERGGTRWDTHRNHVVTATGCGAHLPRDFFVCVGFPLPRSSCIPNLRYTVEIIRASEAGTLDVVTSWNEMPSDSTGKCLVSSADLETRRGDFTSSKV